jgi:hypothetical protein
MNLMRPFATAPDLLQDAQAINDFMGQGMARFEPLAQHFGLAADPEGMLQLAIALQAYAQGEMATAERSLLEFAAVDARMATLGRVFEVLYKAISHDLPGAAESWLSLVAGIFHQCPGHPEAQRLMLEFLTYFGLWTHALNIHAQLAREPFEPWRRHIMLSRARAEGFQPQRRFSFILLTWNRADLLDRCLTEIRAKAGSDDHEILVGVNASSDHTRQVLERHANVRVFWNDSNDSVDYYREIFAAACGATIIEIDDNVVELPVEFDVTLERYLRVFPECGYIGFQPTRLDLATGVQTAMEGAPDSSYVSIQRDGQMIQVGPVWGCCAAISKRDWLEIGGFYGVKLSKVIGEESQIIRKLRMHGRDGARILGQSLIKAY